MHEVSLLGPWIRRFLTEHIPGERNLARNTQRSYRDTLRLLLPAVARRARKPIDRLTVHDVSADRVRQFLSDLEEERSCGIATRNQRLAAVHALARFIGLHAPSASSGVGKFDPCPSRRPRDRWSRIWRRRRWMPSSPPQIWRRRKAAGTTLCCCSCITPGLALTRRPRHALRI